MDAESKAVFTKLTDAVVRQSSTNERVAAALDRLGSGMPKPSVAAFIVVVGLSALVGSMTALAWSAP